MGRRSKEGKGEGESRETVWEREKLYVYVCLWEGGRKREKEEEKQYYSSLKNNRIVTTDSGKDYH